MFRVLLLVLLATQAVPGARAGTGPGPRDGDRLVPLVPRDGGACTADRRWCVLLAGSDAEGPPLPVVRARGATGPAPRPPAEEPAADESHAVWPVLLVLRGGGFLAGVETRTSTAYAGGGGSATGLRLFRVSPDGTATAEPVFDAPLTGSLLIRTCFDERDRRMHRGACHAEFGFSARIGLAPGGAAGLPGLTYTAEAWAFPRGASRSGELGPLRRGDLVRQRDPACSFARRLRFDAAAGLYRPDRPMPECTDYTVP